MTFLEWLEKQSNRNSVVGDLARDVMRDKYPPSENNYEAWERHISRLGHPDAVKAFKQAWKRYEESCTKES